MRIAPGDMTLEEIVEFYRRLTGKEPTPEALAEAKAVLEEDQS